MKRILLFSQVLYIFLCESVQEKSPTARNDSTSSCNNTHIGPEPAKRNFTFLDTTEKELLQQGSILILTPYIERGDISAARILSRVKEKPFPRDVLSYSGYFTVNKYYDSNLFFWFFPAETNSNEAPLILWLQGGPGQPSALGLFLEIGPFSVKNNSENLERNPFSWTKKYSVLFIDSPVGTGFSFTENDEGYSKYQYEISENLYSALRQFFSLFPEIVNNDFYVAGESYGGKHATSLAYTIHKRNEESTKFRINLKGVAVSSGFIDPWSFLNYSEVLYRVGLIDMQTKEEMKEEERKGREAIEEGENIVALQHWARAMGLYRENSGFYQAYNFVYLDIPEIREAAPYYNFLQRSDVTRAIHVGNRRLGTAFQVGPKLHFDFMSSGKEWLQFLLDNGYKVLLFHGQLDVICAYSLAEDFYHALNHTGAEEYRSASRKPWYVDQKLAGYVKSAGNFTEVVILNAGHMVPMDQPQATLELVTNFICNG